MTKEEILKEFRELAMTTWDIPTIEQTGIEAFLSSALDRYALSFVEASVPNKQSEWFETTGDPERERVRAHNAGHNLCREQTLENARKLLSPDA